MLPFLVVLFVAVPLLELAIILQVGREIGVLPTIGILLLDSILGSLLLRSQGREVWRRFNAAMAAGRLPHREIVDGVMVIAGGALLLTPGFLTDVLGLLLLFPPTRAALRRIVLRVAGRRLVVAAVGGAAGRAQRGGFGRPGHDVEGTAVEHEPRARPAAPPRLER